MGRPSKRQKTMTSDSPFNPATDEKHSVFTQWSVDRGVEIHGAKPLRLPGRGLGLINTQKIKKGDRILFVPEKAMFKPDLTLLKKHKLDRISAQAQLALAAMYRFRDEESPLAVWRETWPTQQDFTQCMPLYWRKELQDLVPPPIRLPFERQSEDFEKDWVSVKGFCEAEERGWGRDEFLYYWMIVNSRSFHWKPAKGGRPGAMVMCPFIDYLNHGPTGTTCEVFQRSDGYEVLADRDYAPSTELLATYGSHSNDKLLVHYGFVASPPPSQPPSSDDDLRLDHLILPTLSPALKSQLQDVGYLGGYALLPATNEICFKTQVAVRAALLTCNEWEYFAGCGEDMTGDKSDAVKDFLRPLLKGYAEEAEEKVAAIEELRRGCEKGEEDALGMLITRWEQISDAIEVFLTVEGEAGVVPAWKKRYELRQKRRKAENGRR